MTSERVDAEGVKNVAAAAKEHIKAKVGTSASTRRMYITDSASSSAHAHLSGIVTSGEKVLMSSWLTWYQGGTAVQDRKATTVVSMGSEQDIGRWERLDDVIMGGQSSSTLRATEDGAALFSGDLILEGGGFCGARTKVICPDSQIQRESLAL